MPAYARGDDELQLDRAILVAFILVAGRDCNKTEAWRLLNAEREKRYRKAALDSGKSPEEAEEAGRRARLAVQTVRREVREIIGQVQEAWLGGAAVFLDLQIDAVRDEIEETHLEDEEIKADLRRSRETRWSRTTGVPTKATAGQPAKIEPTAVTRFVQEEEAAEAALYGRLQENRRRRAALRAEERLLRFGRLNLPAVEVDGGGELTMAQAVLARTKAELGDPATARDAAIQRMLTVMQQFDEAAAIPLGPEMVAIERLRRQGKEQELRNLREYLRLPPAAVGAGAPGGSKTFEVSFERLPRRSDPVEIDLEKLAAEPEEGE